MTDATRRIAPAGQADEALLPFYCSRLGTTFRDGDGLHPACLLHCARSHERLAA